MSNVDDVLQMVSDFTVDITTSNSPVHLILDNCNLTDEEQITVFRTLYTQYRDLIFTDYHRSGMHIANLYPFSQDIDRYLRGRSTPTDRNFVVFFQSQRNKSNYKEICYYTLSLLHSKPKIIIHI